MPRPTSKIALYLGSVTSVFWCFRLFTVTFTGDALVNVANCVRSWHIVSQRRSSPWRYGQTSVGRRRVLWRRGWAEESGPPGESLPRVRRRSLVLRFWWNEAAGLVGSRPVRTTGHLPQLWAVFSQSAESGTADGALGSWRCDVALGPKT